MVLSPALQSGSKLSDKSRNAAISPEFSRNKFTSERKLKNNFSKGSILENMDTLIARSKFRNRGLNQSVALPPTNKYDINK